MHGWGHKDRSVYTTLRPALQIFRYEVVGMEEGGVQGEQSANMSGGRLQMQERWHPRRGCGCGKDSEWGEEDTSMSVRKGAAQQQQHEPNRRWRADEGSSRPAPTKPRPELWRQRAHVVDGTSRLCQPGGLMAGVGAGKVEQSVRIGWYV